MAQQVLGKDAEGYILRNDDGTTTTGVKALPPGMTAPPEVEETLPAPTAPPLVESAAPLPPAPEPTFWVAKTQPNKGPATYERLPASEITRQGLTPATEAQAAEAERVLAEDAARAREERKRQDEAGILLWPLGNGEYMVRKPLKTSGNATGQEVYRVGRKEAEKLAKAGGRAVSDAEWRAAMPKEPESLPGDAANSIVYVRTPDGKVAQANAGQAHANGWEMISDEEAARIMAADPEEAARLKQESGIAPPPPEVPVAPTSSAPNPLRNPGAAFAKTFIGAVPQGEGAPVATESLPTLGPRIVGAGTAPNGVPTYSVQRASGDTVTVPASVVPEDIVSEWLKYQPGTQSASTAAPTSTPAKEQGGTHGVLEPLAEGVRQIPGILTDPKRLAELGMSANAVVNPALVAGKPLMDAAGRVLANAQVTGPSVEMRSGAPSERGPVSTPLFSAPMPTVGFIREFPEDTPEKQQARKSAQAGGTAPPAWATAAGVSSDTAPAARTPGDFYQPPQGAQTTAPSATPASLGLSVAAKSRVGGGGGMRSLDAAYAQQAEAEALRASVAGQQAAAEEAVRAEQIKASEQRAIQEQESAQRRTAQMDQWMKDYAALEDKILKDTRMVDPNRWWNNQTTGGKILAGISSFLAGFSGTVGAVQKAISADIESQKEAIARADAKGQTALANRRFLLGVMREKFGDEIAAEQAAKIASLGLTQQRLDLIATQAKGPEAQARALQAKGILEEEKQKTKMDFGIRLGQLALQQQEFNLQAAVAGSKVAMNAMRLPDGSVTGDTDANRLTEDQRERFVPGYGLAKDKEAAKRGTELTGAHSDLMITARRLLDWRLKYGAEKLDRDALAEGNQLLGDLQLNLKTAKNLGTLDKGSEAFLEKLTASDAGEVGFFAPKLKSLIDVENGKFARKLYLTTGIRTTPNSAGAPFLAPR